VEKPPVSSDNPSQVPNNFDEMLEKKLNEKLEEKELNTLEYSDELKTNVKNYAKANGMSISQAIKSPYMDFLKSEEEKKAKIENATIGNKHRSTNSQDVSKMKLEDIDPTTPEGLKLWEEYKNKTKNQN